MKAVILAGGKGTRLKPYTTILPKPLMPIGDMPILEILLRQMRRAGVDEAVLTVGHLAELLRLWPARRVEGEYGPVTQGLAIRLRLQRSDAVAEIDLGDDARFWPCDEAMGRWRNIAQGGSAGIVYE